MSKEMPINQPEKKAEFSSEAIARENEHFQVSRKFALTPDQSIEFCERFPTLRVTSKRIKELKAPKSLIEKEAFEKSAREALKYVEACHVENTRIRAEEEQASLDDKSPVEVGKKLITRFALNKEQQVQFDKMYKDVDYDYNDRDKDQVDRYFEKLGLAVEYLRKCRADNESLKPSSEIINIPLYEGVVERFGLNKEQRSYLYNKMHLTGRLNLNPHHIGSKLYDMWELKIHEQDMLEALAYCNKCKEENAKLQQLHEEFQS